MAILEGVQFLFSSASVCTPDRRRLVYWLDCRYSLGVLLADGPGARDDDVYKTTQLSLPEFGSSTVVSQFPKTQFNVLFSLINSPKPPSILFIIIYDNKGNK